MSQSKRREDLTLAALLFEGYYLYEVAYNIPMMTQTKIIEVELTFLTTQEGGRVNPVFSGYRPQFYYDGRDWDAIHEYIGTDRVAPGETVKAYLNFLHPQYHVGKLSTGQEFLIREGSRTVAKGIITEILELAEPAS